MMSQVSTEIGESRTQIGDFLNTESLALIHDRIAAAIARLPETRAGDERASLPNGRLWRLRGTHRLYIAEDASRCPSLDAHTSR
jgi:hypothetical protein